MTIFSGTNKCEPLDESKFFDIENNLQVIDDGYAHEKNYFHINASDFESDWGSTDCIVHNDRF